MTEITGKRPGVLVDRDGTLIREVGYLRRVEQIEILPGVPEAIRLLHRNGFIARTTRPRGWIPIGSPAIAANRTWVWPDAP